MSKEDTVPGFLSKMVKFVRSPVTSWGDLDTVQTEREDAMSKQLLKEMIERKRRNDFVRKREFGMLRKLRKRDALISVGQDPAVRPSFFQSSMPSRPDDRAGTLKKIDEIEAQMSMQWWKTKTGTSTGHSIQALQALPASESKMPLMNDAPHGLNSALTAVYQATTQDPLGYQSDEKVTIPGGSFEIQTEPASLPMPSGYSAMPFGGETILPPLTDREFAVGMFTSSGLMTLDFREVVHDTEVEEAAIRFANGDDAGAEAALLQILEPGASRAGNPETWLTLFDLYRATGQQDEFEMAALKFVGLFDRSAPQWFSMPDVEKAKTRPMDLTATNPAANWICPSVFGVKTLQALKAAIARAQMPWCIDWSQLKVIELAVAESLHEQFEAWSTQKIQICFLGEAQLLQVLHTATPSYQRDVFQIWWRLRMEALRVTHRPDDFELTALDFCVTYEVSPPAWESARCEYRSLNAPVLAFPELSVVDDMTRESRPNSQTLEWDTQLEAINSQFGNFTAIELSGQVCGDSIEVLDKLNFTLMGADTMVISCAMLIRVDFSAAGVLLNWVSAQQGENRTVQFTEVNRLVAAFFNVIGITEHTAVMVRSD